jgi:hypothetical protein
MSWMISVASTRSSHAAPGECTKVYAWPSAFLSAREISSHRLFSLRTSRLSVASSSRGYRISGGLPLMKRESDGVARGRNDRDHYQHNDDETIFLAHPLPKHTGGRLPMANGPSRRRFVAQSNRKPARIDQELPVLERHRAPGLRDSVSCAIGSTD